MASNRPAARCVSGSIPAMNACTTCLSWQLVSVAWFGWFLVQTLPEPEVAKSVNKKCKFCQFLAYPTPT